MQLTLLLTVLAVCSPVLQAGTASYHRTGSCTVSSCLLTFAFIFVVVVVAVRVRRQLHYLYCAFDLQSNHQACTYKYHSTQSNFDGEQRQTTKVQATVDVRCSSGDVHAWAAQPHTIHVAMYVNLKDVIYLLFAVGTHGVQRATRYCMSVKDVTVSGDLFKGSRYSYYILYKLRATMHQCMILISHLFVR